MIKKIITIVATTSFLCACTSSTPRIAVDPSSIEDQAAYDEAFNSCLSLAKTVDLNSEKAAKGVAGAALGVAVVGGVATAVAGAIFAPAIPFMIAGGLAGGGLWSNSISKEEKQAREVILLQCLSDKGYKVYGSKSL